MLPLSSSSVPFKSLGLVVACSLWLSGCSHRTAIKQTPQPQGYESALTSSPALIILDAGHGGKDTGAINAQVNIKEKTLALKTAKLVQGKLEKLGYKVFMIRTRDEFIDLDKRVQMANRHRDSLLVSLHFNSAKNRHAQGIEVFYYDDPEEPARHAKSLKLAGYLLQETTQKTKAISRGAKPAAFRVIKNTHMPACLIEGGFVTHAREAKRLSSTLYLEKLADGITSAIALYCGKPLPALKSSSKGPVKPAAPTPAGINPLQTSSPTPAKAPLKPALERISPPGKI